MSVSQIPDKVKLRLWIAAGGRCEYPGCNKPLFKDELTLTKMNVAYIAHIVSDKLRGPRGDKMLSPQFRKSLPNLMLMCDVHHRLIDKTAIKMHPVPLLTQCKREHEERIELLTSIQQDKKTHVVMCGANIGQRQGLVSFDQARDAVVPKRYPASDQAISLDLTQDSVTDDDPAFWAHHRKNIDMFVDTRLRGAGPDGKAIRHLSVFAIAPIPILIYLGKRIGDIIAVEVYQRHRDTQDWKWQDTFNIEFQYITTRPRRPIRRRRKVAVHLSLSGSIDRMEIWKALHGKMPLYGITIERPDRDYLKSEEQLRMFERQFRGLLSEIRSNHGGNLQIHLFPAIPVSVAIQIGRLLLPKSDPPLVVYDFNRKRGGWQRTLTV